MYYVLGAIELLTVKEVGLVNRINVKTIAKCKSRNA